MAYLTCVKDICYVAFTYGNNVLSAVVRQCGVSICQIISPLSVATIYTGPKLGRHCVRKCHHLTVFSLYLALN